MGVEEEPIHQLSAYTLNHGGPAFIHQHVVDAYAAQNANERTKPITITFALAGLYLHIEKNFTGREVQLAHMKMAKNKQPWPSFPLPADRGAITEREVLAAPAGAKRDAMIEAWAATVWAAFRDSRDTVAAVLRQCRIP